MMISIRDIQDKTGVCFGTSGMRGLVSQMTDVVCKSYTLAFLQHIKIESGESIAIGMDLRPSSPKIAKACMEAVLESQCYVDFCGQIPTPALALYAKNKKIAAIMVTGSHIPYDRNGIKFYSHEGEINKDDELAITSASVELKHYLVTSVFSSVNHEALKLYINRYLSLFSKDKFLGWRIGVYQHSSVARDCLVEILEALGAKVIPIERTDQFVPIDTESVSELDEARARDWVKRYQLHALVTTDGDGDRPLIADETGQWLRGDLVGMLTAVYLGARSVVVPISCNTAIELSGYFDKVVRTRIGSPYVLAGMTKLSGVVPLAGFEANGGFIAGSKLSLNGKKIEELLTRDAILPILCVLAKAVEKGEAVSALLVDLPQRYTASGRLINISTSQSQNILKFIENQPDVLRNIDKQLSQVTDVTHLDGIRISFRNGDIVHFRASGNAPELRCYVESDKLIRSSTLINKILGNMNIDGFNIQNV